MTFAPESTEPPPPSLEPPPLPVIATPSPARRLLFTVLFFAAVIIHTNPIWAPPVFNALGQANPFRDPTPPGSISVLPIITQARMFIGVGNLVNSGNLPGPVKQQQAADMENMAGALRELGNTKLSPSHIRVLLVIFHHLEWPEAEAMRDRLGKTPPPDAPEAARFDAIIRKLYLDEKPLDAAELAEVNKRIEFLGELVTLRTYRLNADKRAPALEKKINDEAQSFALRLLAGAVFLTLGGLGGVALLVLFARNIIAGRIRSGMPDSRVPPHLGFEAITLYLVLMFLLPMLTRSIQIPGLGPLGASWTLPFIFILSAGYPLSQPSTQTSRVHWAPLRHDLGLNLGRSFTTETIFGIAGYIAFLPLMGLAMMITILISRYTGVDQGEGAHPIVPILLQGEGGFLVRVFIFLLAVVLAPVTEEIIFRGYFYRFLRSKYDTANSVFISAALFAGIHPQGMMGFFPLLAIGLALGALREWRGSLVAPMVMHACVNGVTLALVMQMT